MNFSNRKTTTWKNLSLNLCAFGALAGVVIPGCGRMPKESNGGPSGKTPVIAKLPVDPNLQKKMEDIPKAPVPKTPQKAYFEQSSSGYILVDGSCRFPVDPRFKYTQPFKFGPEYVWRQDGGIGINMKNRVQREGPYVVCASPNSDLKLTISQSGTGYGPVSSSDGKCIAFAFSNRNPEGNEFHIWTNDFRHTVKVKPGYVRSLKIEMEPKPSGIIGYKLVVDLINEENKKGQWSYPVH